MKLFYLIKFSLRQPCIDVYRNNVYLNLVHEVLQTLISKDKILINF